MNNEIKDKVRAQVQSYIEEFRDEYEAVKQFVKDEREMLKNDFASSDDLSLGRRLVEFPETLHNMIMSALTEEERVIIKSGESSIEYIRWFAKNFPEFRIPERL